MIGIISFNSLRYYQFLYKYTMIFEKNNIDYEVIFWNREGEKIEKDDNWIHYDYQMNTFQPFYKKLFGFLKYTMYIRKMIKIKKYEKLIVLTTQTAIPLIDILLKKYKNKYIFDYRDITYENFTLYKKNVEKLINNSYFTAISSDGYKDYFGNLDKFILSHNCRDFSLLSIDNNSIKGKFIRVVYWGMVRQLETNYKICDYFGNNNRFELIYHGSGYHTQLKEYCDKNKYENIKITGKYELKDIEEFAKNTDLLLNIYANDKVQKNAMTVKFYDSIQYGIPMIVNKGSYMAKIVEENYLGIVIDLDDKEFLDNLYIKFKKFDMDKYMNNREKIFKKIIKDDEKFERELLLYVRGE